ncbi:2Fe-2S iron-sulfur cluster-binding protein [Sphingomonas endophytica]|uniref:2Fe-2S ferredoxin n=1 Tax=Sphingomonas endophytica TaxID=869719 RepID=A0A147HYN6_9SPHN|nr:2Fe-2S iron-sulfur cluster-binding protein [Sphingomonas endophytica]KTT70105.1 2Fe-2S ferredoxin [Sphingomonas endophytica]
MRVMIDGREWAATAGERLLDVARRNGLALEGTCNGDLACATCHVIVAADWFDRLTPAREEEEDMLDLVADARRTSRLACQIVLTPALDKLSVSLP